MHGLPLETVRTWTKNGKLAHIKIGDSIMIEKSTPLPEKRKPGRKTKEEKVRAEVENFMNSRNLKVKITPAYYIAIEDASGNILCSPGLKYKK